MIPFDDVIISVKPAVQFDTMACVTEEVFHITRIIDKPLL